jgi:glycosyltransferase involved in cell wall biosynthesis
MTPTTTPPVGTSLRVAMLVRAPRAFDYSIENVFELVRDHLPDGIEPAWIRCPYPNMGVLPRVRSLRWAYRQRRSGADVFHVTGDASFLTIGLDGSRTVVTVHDCEFLTRAGPVKRWLFRWLWLRLPVGRARVVVTPTEAVRDDVLRLVRVDPGKIRVIHNPVNPIFAPAPRLAPAASPVILQIGTRSNKNLERVVRALKGLPCRLVIVGRLSAEQRALLAACAVDHEERSGMTLEQMAACYRECDLVVFVSTIEGFGLPIIEAQASGRPVVIGNRPPLPEVAGPGSLEVDPLDVAAIRAAIERVIDDETLRTRLVEEGTRNVQRFDATSVARAYAAVYAEVLAPPSTSAR